MIYIFILITITSDFFGRKTIGVSSYKTEKQCQEALYKTTVKRAGCIKTELYK